MKTTVKECLILPVTTIIRPEGDLGVIQELTHIPFCIRRVYYLYKVPDGKSRGSHAHRKLWQLLIAINGSFDVTVDDGHAVQIFHMNDPRHGLLIPPGIWRELVNFQNTGICLVLASRRYDEKDYIRNYYNFLELKQYESTLHIS
jgi:dTDP-4-dehydrorhamnose 3,5-epimerase-like enzyme